MIYDMIYLLTANGQPPGGSSTVHIYTQTIHRTTQNKQYIEQHKKFGRMWAVSIFAGLTLAFALQMRKKRGKNSIRFAEECQLAR
jgi:ABC-type sugar transport system permease subunit